MSPPIVQLPAGDGTVDRYRMREPVDWPKPGGPITSRIAYAAVHVAPSPLADNLPGAPAVIDWESTLGFRRHIWGYGLRVAEAMDTAQRGMGLDWDAAHELIRRSAAEARASGGVVAAGAGTDHVSPDLASLEEVSRAYLQQVEAVEEAGAQVVLMASRQLARLAGGPEDYAKVYAVVLDQVTNPVILHWLGPMFDPQLTGYWGSADLEEATDVVVALIAEHSPRIDGIKVSLMDERLEVRLRRRLPDGVRLYTGDDFNFPELIRGDGAGYSDALLGIFDAIAPPASAALQALDRGDVTGFDSMLEPTVPLARHLFSPPTYYYKTGLVFLSWLAGHHPGFQLVGGLASARSVPHLATAFRLADAAGLFPDPELAAARMRAYLTVAGVGF